MLLPWIAANGVMDAVDWSSANPRETGGIEIETGVWLVEDAPVIGGKEETEEDDCIGNKVGILEKDVEGSVGRQSAFTLKLIKLKVSK